MYKSTDVGPSSTSGSPLDRSQNRSLDDNDYNFDNEWQQESSELPQQKSPKVISTKTTSSGVLLPRGATKACKNHALEKKQPLSRYQDNSESDDPGYGKCVVCNLFICAGCKKEYKTEDKALSCSLKCLDKRFSTSGLPLDRSQISSKGNAELSASRTPQMPTSALVQPKSVSTSSATLPIRDSDQRYLDEFMRQEQQTQREDGGCRLTYW